MEEEARKTLPAGASTKDVLVKVLQETAGTKQFAGESLSNYVREAAKKVYAEAAGDASKALNDAQWHELLDGRLAKSYLEIHHTAVKDVAKRILLDKNPAKFSAYTDAQWKTLFDAMPSYPLDIIEHQGTAKTGVEGVGFHDFLNNALAKIKLAPGEEMSAEQGLNALQNAYSNWGDDAANGIQDGTNIFNVVENWIDEVSK